MAGPAIIVVACLSMVALAIRTDDGLVADDYYKRGLAVNQTLERAARGAALALAATVSIDGDGGATVALDGGGDAPDAHPPSLRLRLAHPTRAGDDRAAVLARVGEGRYRGRVEPLDAGRWRVIVETDRWRLPPVEARAPIGEVRLEAAR
jgi:hypothetical protein